MSTSLLIGGESYGWYLAACFSGSLHLSAPPGANGGGKLQSRRSQHRRRFRKSQLRHPLLLLRIFIGLMTVSSSRRLRRGYGQPSKSIQAAKGRIFLFA